MTATDQAGNTSAASTNTFNYDTTAPLVAITQVNGSTVSFPYYTNAASVTSIGGTCGHVTGDTGTINVTVNGSSASPATASCPSGTWTLTFTTALTAQATYTLAATELDAAGNLGSSGNQSLTIDSTTPTVSTVTSSLGAGRYTVGQVVPVTVTFSEPVNVTGTPKLTLNTTPTNEVVSYASGSGTNQLLFNYTVVAGDNSSRLDYASTSGLANAGGSTIKSLAGTSATLTLPTVGTDGLYGQNIVIDTTAPTAAAIASLPYSPANGTPDSGDQIIYTFSELMSANSILSGWNGLSTTVSASFDTSGTGCTHECLTITGTNLGGVDLGSGSDYVDNHGHAYSFPSSTMVMTTNGNESVVTITLGGTPTNTPKTDTHSYKMVWTPSANASDLAGNAMSTATATETTAAENF